MSSWITITLLETGERSFEYSLKEKLAEQSQVQKVARTDHHPVALTNNAKWDVAERIISEINHWEKAVICRCNDTSDLGHAKYYKRAEESWHTDKEFKMIDEFDEQELAHGRPQGAKACAYMYLMHDIHAVSSLNRPRLHTRKVPALGEERTEFQENAKEVLKFVEDNKYNRERIESNLRQMLDKVEEGWWELDG